MKIRSSSVNKAITVLFKTHGKNAALCVFLDCGAEAGWDVAGLPDEGRMYGQARLVSCRPCSAHR